MVEPRRRLPHDDAAHQLPAALLARQPLELLDGEPVSAGLGTVRHGSLHVWGGLQARAGSRARPWWFGPRGQPRGARQSIDRGPFKPTIPGSSPGATPAAPRRSPRAGVWTIVTTISTPIPGPLEPARFIDRPN